MSIEVTNASGLVRREVAVLLPVALRAPYKKSWSMRATTERQPEPISKYPPAEPGALSLGPLEAASGSLPGPDR
jgi:hypothetical protein